MSFRKTFSFLALALLSLATSCTTRYQDMLKERDERIRELSGEVARLRGVSDDLERRLASQPQAVPASAEKEMASDKEIDDLNQELGEGAYASRRRGRLSIGVDDRVTFDSGSSALKDSSHRLLRNVANALKGKYSNYRYYIEGHTDTDPISKTKDKYSSNRHLSAMRADSVARFLVQQGVPESQIVVVAYGQFDPRDPKSKAANRRVEIVVGEKL